jgi:hypothetical protein
LFNRQAIPHETHESFELEQFIGSVGVSFLILREPIQWLQIPSREASSGNV